MTTEELERLLEIDDTYLDTDTFRAIITDLLDARRKQAEIVAAWDGAHFNVSGCRERLAAAIDAVRP